MEPKISVGPVRLRCLLSPKDQAESAVEHTSQELTGKGKPGDINFGGFSTELLFQQAYGARQDYRE